MLVVAARAQVACSGALLHSEANRDRSSDSSELRNLRTSGRGPALRPCPLRALRRLRCAPPGNSGSSELRAFGISRTRSSEPGSSDIAGAPKRRSSENSGNSDGGLRGTTLCGPRYGARLQAPEVRGQRATLNSKRRCRMDLASTCAACPRLPAEAKRFGLADAELAAVLSGPESSTSPGALSPRISPS
eukprot:10280701-Alexandrium_andersonii.AAC.1